MPAKLFRQHPKLCSRVLEAATRAFTPDVSLKVGTWLFTARLMDGVTAASREAAPEQLPDAALLSNTQLTTRMCSQLVSGLKQLQVASKPEFDMQQLRMVLDIANNTASTASKIIPDPATDMRAEHAAAISAWLAVTGRSLVTIGQLQALVPAWKEASWQTTGATVSAMRAHLHILMQHAEAVTWLERMLSELLTLQKEEAAGKKKHKKPSSADSGGAAAAAVLDAIAPAALEDLHQRAVMLLERLEPLLQQGRAAEVSSHAAASDQMALAAATDAFSDACADGWLPKGLQGLGAGVWTAFPPTWACSDPVCANVDGLTEAAGIKKCLNCQVGCWLTV